MNRTEAMKAARQHVYMNRFGAQWIVVSPWRMTDVSGPVTESVPTWWDRALDICAEGKTELALVLLGWSEREAEMAAQWYNTGRFEDRVRQALAEPGEWTANPGLGRTGV